MGATIIDKGLVLHTIGGVNPPAPALRLASLEDYEAIHAIEGTASKALGSRYPARMKRSISKGKVTVAVVNSDVVGFVEWNNPQRGVNKGFTVIYKVAVHPDYRRQGFGKRLVQSVNTPMLLHSKNSEHYFDFYENACGMLCVRFDGKLLTFIRKTSWT